MDAGFTLKLENPKNSANIFSKLFFGWMIKICYKGTKRGLKILDLYKVLTKDSSERLTDKLEKNWENEFIHKKSLNKAPSLLRALTKTFIASYMIYGLILFIQLVLFRSFQPVVLSYFISLFEANNNDTTAMYISAAILVSMSLLIVFTQHHVEIGQALIGMRLRVAVSSLIYRKLLKLSNKSLGQTAAGQVINLLSNDVNRFDMVTIGLHYFWIIPFQTVLITYLIWREVGISSLAGVLFMALLTVPIQAYLGKLTSSIRLKVAVRSDSRVKLMNEVITGIQVIKMYAWEKPFEEIIKYARQKEINVLTKASYLRGIYVSCMVFIERTTLCLTIISYILLGNSISADKVFSMAQFFNILQLGMAIYYPMAISVGAETLVSIKRLQDFLMLDEKQESVIEKVPEKELELKNINASWTPSVTTLKNINLKLVPGTLCAIIGPVGAGKSSILQLLLGELPQNNGHIKIGGKISYASQEPWLFASTVRNNITFGKNYDKNLYKNVVKVCALEKDFEQFPQGDKTMVGERGVSLSGGQRARINLARAVYRQADLYLLDDPLSAVDTHVGRHLFDQCIVKYLSGKTRILVTHQLQYLKKADIIVVLNNGYIEAKGTFEELSKNNLDFTKLLVSADETGEKEQNKVEDRRQSIISSSSLKSEVLDELVKNEEEMGSSDSSPFKSYVKASGNCCTIFTLISILLLGQAACSGADYWVTFWTQQEAVRNLTNVTPQTLEIIDYIPLNETTNENKYYGYNFHNFFLEEVIINDEIKYLVKKDLSMYIYVSLIICAIIISMIRSFAFFKMAMVASKNLHNKMFHALLKAPMRFFDTNPSGRVLNRFSKDMGAIDEILPRVLVEAIQILLVMGGILVMVTIANYYMVIAMVILGGLFLKVRTWYIMTAKDIKHMEGITKSPVFSHLNSSLNGITTIRATQAEEMLKKEFDNHQDVHSSAWFLTIGSRVCFGLWLDLICVIFVAVIAFSFVILTQYSTVSGSVVGLAISQALILTGMLQYGMRQTAEVVNQLTSVERVLQYTKLENEEINDAKLIELESSWPANGLIEFRNMYLQYIETDAPVLKNLNFTINPGSKIGIVGRTGAGKSSLISALFRLAPIQGAIFIDGIDTKLVTLHQLRKKISIIPQEPVLFSATLRYNLDPFYEYEDTNLWKALEEVELKDSITSLDFMVSAGGSNFSLGQRQLLCLARAILRNNKILVLDEATANVDPKTDALIQRTIRNKFKDCTVLTIAHRLNTIMDSDKVLVMHSGLMAEYDHPHLLLQNPEGYFTKMVEETGKSMAEQLRNVSFQFYMSNIENVVSI